MLHYKNNFTLFFHESIYSNKYIITVSTGVFKFFSFIRLFLKQEIADIRHRFLSAVFLKKTSWNTKDKLQSIRQMMHLLVNE